MPISGGKYVAPTWVNSTSPPIDADELQDICDSIEAYADPASTVPTIPNPNLLDNWYFVGGGSQQGGGQFPINTRGQTSYTTHNQITVDRWIFRNLSSVAINAGYITLTGADNSLYGLIWQPINNPQELIGKTVTVSILCRGSNSVRAQLLNNTKNLAIVRASSSVSSSAFSVVSATATVTDADISAGDAVYMTIYSSDPSAGVYSQTLDVVAVKMELGDTQTLAHQENGVWVLNEIPNYDIQFARCSELPSVPARYESGTYVGTGTIGSSNPNTLTFGFKPKYVMVTGTSSYGTLSAQFVSGMTTVVTRSSTAYTYSVTWGDNSISWYRNTTNTGQAWTQMNSSGDTYYYVSIG